MKSEFRRNVATLVTGTAIAQLIPILISPILTRIYSPDDFGVYAVYFSILMICSVFAAGRYEMAVVLPENNVDAKRLVQVCFLIAAAVCIVLLVLAVLLFMIPLPESLEKTRTTLLVLPIGVFLVAISQTLHYYNNRKGEYRKLAKSRVVRSITYSIAALAGGFIKTPGVGLAIGDVVGYLCNNLYLSIRRGNMQPLNLDWSQMKKIARRYSNFPKYLIISGLFEKGSGQAPVLFINNLFHGTIQAGYFSFAQRIIITPADLIARAITDVFRQRASLEFAENRNCYPLFKSTFKNLILIGSIPFTIGHFVVIDVFAFVFGDEWAVAGQYAQIMMPMFFLQFIVSPLSILFVIAEKQKYDLILQIMLLLGVVASFLLGYFIHQDVETAVKLFTLVYCTKYLVELYLAYQFSKGR